MNAYRIDIWRGVKHNGAHVANDSRVVTIHARNETEAKSKIVLREGYTQELPQLKLEVSNEFIYSYEKIGTVVIKPFYVHSGDRSPISVEEYKARLKKMSQSK